MIWYETLANEVIKQDDIWGAQREISPEKWLAIAAEEFAELCQAVLGDFRSGNHNLRTERLQLMAILLRWQRADNFAGDRIVSAQ